MTYDSSERYTTRGPRAERVQSAGSANLRKNKPLSGRSIAFGVSSERERIGNAHTRKSTKCELLALQAFAVCCCHHVLKTSKLISALASSDTSARICVTDEVVVCTVLRTNDGSTQQINTHFWWEMRMLSSHLGWCDL